MITKKYKFADIAFEVTSIYENVHRFCKDYETDDAPVFSVVITQADIEFETERELKVAKCEARAPLHLPDGSLERLAVYRKFSERCPDWDRVLFHGSCVAVDGEGYLFTAKSGTGKSTHTTLWRQYLGEKAVMVNDDKPILHITETGVTVYGTPYNGKHHLGSNIAVPLKAICILERAQENHIEPITKAQAYAMLMQQTYRPQDIDAMRKTLELVDKLADNTALYRLSCNMNPDAAKVAYYGMKG